MESSELYKRYRPSSLKGIYGQEQSVSMIKGLLKSGVPHAILFSGPSGCGKTTIARILKDKLKCHDIDYNELNSAQYRGIDTIRDLQSKIGLSAVASDCRMWVLDEAHKISNDGQNALLKMLEDTPSHVYFVLCTTDPERLIPAILTRCSQIKLSLLSEPDLIDLIKSIVRKEKKTIDDEVAERLAKAADGSARRALVLLEQILNIENSEDQLECILKSDHKLQAVAIAQALLDSRTKWDQMAKILKGVEEEPETIRYLVLGYCTKVMLGGGRASAKANQIIVEFSNDFYSSKKAGLVSACYEIISKNK